MTTLCAFDGCTDVGIFPAAPGSPVLYCFVHDPVAATAFDPPPADDTPAPVTFHHDVVAGLAAMVLEHTAMTTLDVDDATSDAVRSLAANTGMTEDVAAGILLATTYIMAAGGIGADELLRGAELYESDAVDDDPQPDVDADDGWEDVDDGFDVFDDVDRNDLDGTVPSEQESEGANDGEG